MNQKEVGELRRRWRPDRAAVNHIYGCFVDSGKNIVSELDESLGLMAEDEKETYLGLLKKSLSGRLGRNLVDIVFSTQQVMDSDEHRLLSGLRGSECKDASLRRKLYETIAGSFESDEQSYLILLACDSYDVPHRAKDGAALEDSDEVFTYILCSICPIKEGKMALSYFPGEGEFRCAADRVVSAPAAGFLFPAFDSRSANIYNALYYAHRPDELHPELIDALFRTPEPPLSAGEQRERFESALLESLGDECSMEVAQAVHGQLSARLEAHKESRDPEPLTMTAGEVGGVLADCGVRQEKVEAFETRCTEDFGPGAVLSPGNLIDTGRFEVKTSEAKLALAPDRSFVVETRVIDGKCYLLIPAEEGMEINGLPVHLETLEE